MSEIDVCGMNQAKELTVPSNYVVNGNSNNGCMLSLTCNALEKKCGFKTLTAIPIEALRCSNT